MSAVGAIARLLRLVVALERGELPDPGDARWLTEAVRRYEREAPSGTTLETALQLAARRGSRCWWTADRLRERDRALREFAREHFPRLSLTEAACEIATEVRRARALQGVPTDSRRRQLAAVDAKHRVPGPDRLREILASS